MRSIKTSVAFNILVGLVIITCLIKLLITPSNKQNIAFIIDCFSTSVTVCSIISVLFCTHLWKYKVFKGWFVQIPNLNGSWKGSLTSTWEGSRPIAINLVIEQSLFSISCVTHTNESKSESISCDCIIDKNNQKQQLTYTYVNTPNLIYREGSPMHNGSVILDIKGNTLSGNYWTDRKTTGCFELKKE